MTAYRRTRVSGGTYFFTVNLAERQQTLLIDHIDLLRRVFAKESRAHPFWIDALVVLPNHLHALFNLAGGRR